MYYKSRLLFTLLILAAIIPAAQAIRITDLEVKGEPVDYLDVFYVKAELSGDTCDHEAWFYINDYIFARKNVPCDTDDIEVKFDLDDDEWELHKIICGQAIAKVELYTGVTKHMVTNDSTSFDIGYVPEVVFSPAQPTPGKSVRVKLVDKENGNTLKNVDVHIKDIYGGDPISKRTTGDGSFTFTPDVAGEYRMSIRERDICGEKTFWIKRPLIIDGPHPETPVVGEMIQVAVPAGSSVGVKVFDPDGEVYKRLQSTYNGGANFTIEDPGTYTITFGDLSTKYWGMNKTLEVSGRLRPDLKIAPEKPVVGKPVTVTVTSRGSPLSDAKVTITKPDGVEREYTTTSFGTLTYDSVISTGIYEVRATKSRFDPNSATFEAKHEFQTKVTPDNPTVEDTVTIEVQDQEGKPISDVLVEIPELNERKVTDMGGKLVLELQQPRQYTFKLSKDLFWEKQTQVTPFGMLNVGECQGEIPLGTDISFTVLNNFNEPTEAEILIKQPSGIVKQYTGSEKTYAPEMPGEYFITVRKTNYGSANKTFKVLPHPISLAASMSAGKLFVNVSHEQTPLPAILVSATIGGKGMNTTTNDMGVAVFSVTREGNVTVIANPGMGSQMYGEGKTIFKVTRSYDLWLLTGPLLVIFVISLMTIVAIQLGRKYLGDGLSLPSKGVVKKKGADEPKRKSAIIKEKASGRSRLSDL